VNGVCEICGIACTNVSAVRFAKGYGRRCAEHSPTNHHREAIPCVTCGRLFKSKGHAEAKYCSRKCAGLAHQIPHSPGAGRARRARVNLNDLGERDGWRCHICSKQVKRENASHDHLIPFSYGGSDEWTNIALAHRSCNSARWIGRIPVQLPLGASAEPRPEGLSPTERQCAYCGEPFALSSRWRYCSPFCALAMMRVRNRESYRPKLRRHPRHKWEYPVKNLNRQSLGVVAVPCKG